MEKSFHGNWNDAKNKCAASSSNSHLAVIDSLAVNDIISIILDRYGYETWIGLSLEDSEHTWSTEMKVNYTNWEATNFTYFERKCTKMFGQQHKKGKWMDTDCEDKMSVSLCQTNQVLQSRSTSSVVSSYPIFIGEGCAESFYVYETRCYTVSKSEHMPIRNETQLRDYVSSYCLSRMPVIGIKCGTDPRTPWGSPMCVVPHTISRPPEAAFIRALLGHMTNFSEAWIGIKLAVFSNSSEMHVLSEDDLQSASTDLIYFDMASLTKEALSQRKAVTYKCLVISVHTERLLLRPCNTTGMPAVCSYSLGGNPQYDKTEINSKYCPTNWTQLNGKCYQTSRASDERKDWDSSEQTCKELGESARKFNKVNYVGHLASIKSVAEKQAIDTLTNVGSSWIGLQQIVLPRRNRFDDPVSFRWSDHSPLTYFGGTLWSNKYKPMSFVRMCFTIFDNQSFWIPMRCASLRGYVCQLSIEDNYPATHIALNSFRDHSLPSTCMDGEKFCLLYLPLNENFFNALNSCGSSGKTLAVIADRKYQEFVIQTLNGSLSRRRAYVGLYSIEAEHYWTSLYPKLPIGAKDTDPPKIGNYCASISFEFDGSIQWHWGSCKQKLGYICTTDPASFAAERKPETIKKLDCSKNFINVGDGCYLIKSSDEEKVTHEEAAKHCLELDSDARLAQITSRYEKDMISILLDRNTSPVWIASSGIDASRGNKQCTLMFGQRIGGGKLVTSADCHRRFGFICKKSPGSDINGSGSSSIISTIFEQGACLDSFYEFGSRCFTLVTHPFVRFPNSSINSHCLNTVKYPSIKCGNPDDYIWGSQRCPVYTSLETRRDVAFVRSMMHTLDSVNQADAWIGMMVHQLPSTGKLVIVAQDGIKIAYADFVNLDLVPPVSEALQLLSKFPHLCLAVSKQSDRLKLLDCSTENLSAVCSYHFEESFLARERCTTVMGKEFCVQLHPPLPFVEASKSCQAKERTLAIVMNHEEQAFITKYLQSEYQQHTTLQAYVGLFVVGDAIHWTISDQNIFATFWNTKPSTRVPQCAYIDTAVSGFNNWRFGSCNLALPYVCTTAYHLASDISYKSTSPSHICPNGYFKLKESCFMVISGLQASETWSDASKACEWSAANAHLATINTLVQNDALSILLDERDSHVWIGLKFFDNVPRWKNGRPVTFMNLDLNQEVESKDKCVQLANPKNGTDQWIAAECGQLAGYICQASPEPSGNQREVTGSPLLMKGICIDGFYEYNGRCFSIYNEGDMPARSESHLRDDVSRKCFDTLQLQHDTESQCTASNQTLWGSKDCPVPASVVTPAEAAFIRALMEYAMEANHELAWIGVKMVLSSSDNNIRIINEDKSDQSFNAVIDFPFEESIDKGETQSKSLTFKCFALSRQTKRFILKPCSNKNIPVVCSYYPNHDWKKRFSNSAFDECPDGWKLKRGKCLLHHADISKSWYDAEEHCQQNGKLTAMKEGTPLFGHLASIHSEFEQNILGSEPKHQQIWIGLRMQFLPFENMPNSSGVVRYIWSDDSPSDFISGTTGNPTFKTDYPQEMCIVIRKGQLKEWIADSCNQTYGYICQLSKLKSFFKPREQLKPEETSNYQIVQKKSNWKEAKDYCRQQQPSKELASIHNEEELTELSKYLESELSANVTPWIGLFETNRAYAWTDNSTVNFLPLSAENSKQGRYYFQDCFVISPTNQTGSSTAWIWLAQDCDIDQLAFVCQRQIPQTHSVVSEKQRDSEASDRRIECPAGYRSYWDRCFTILRVPLTWNEADRLCRTKASAANLLGSLARIDTYQVQEFVSSLIGAAPREEQAIWIGLLRTVRDVHNVYHTWTDGHPVTHLQPIFKMREPGSNELQQKNICISMYRSHFAQLNGLWIHSSCDRRTKQIGVCQAYVMPEGHSEASTYYTRSIDLGHSCPESFHLGPTIHPSETFTQGTSCYRLLSTTERFDWQTSKLKCEKLGNTYNQSVQLLYISSVFDANFLRARLPLMHSSGAAQFSSEEAVWTALNVEQPCPACLANWSWSVSPAEPVRYTDWRIPPMKPSGCFLFHLSPYSTHSKSYLSGLSSLRPAVSCEHQHFAVCQTAAINSTSQTPALKKQAVRPKCLKLVRKELSLYDLVRGSVRITETGKSCVRWDLVSDVLRTSTWFRYRLTASINVGGEAPSYSEDFCSELIDTINDTAKYGCYISLDPVNFETCPISSCLDNVGKTENEDDDKDDDKHGMLYFLILIPVAIACTLFVLWFYRKRLILAHKPKTTDDVIPLE